MNHVNRKLSRPTSVPSSWLGGCRTLPVLALMALGLMGCSSPVTALADRGITAVPTRIAHTALGAVGYREIGHGRALLLITGFSAGMDDWAPSFVDALAQHHRVIVFDNAGVGDTASLTAPLSVAQMAGQTSALITALRVGPCDVLGWSMGGMIAQALAVTHPGQVRRLVLAATQAGTGKAAPVPAAAQAVLDSGNPAATLQLLFPADQTAAARGYAAAIRSYPGYYTASAHVRTEQQGAVNQWLAGGDASGRQPQRIGAPTLVADGSEDALDPVSNDRMLVRLIHGARLVLYPDAGHGFLFQDVGRFVAELDAFLK